MFCPGPFHAKTLQRGADGFATDTLLHQLILITDFGRQTQGPQTGGPPKVPWTLVQDLFQLFHAGCGKGRLGGVRTPRAFLQDRQSVLIKSADHVPYGLIVTAQRGRDLNRLFRLVRSLKQFGYV